MAKKRKTSQQDTRRGSRTSRVCWTRRGARNVRAQWDGHEKGKTIPAWLIARADDACRQESLFLNGKRNDGVWPVDRSSQLPLLIAYLDARARARGQKPRG